MYPLHRKQTNKLSVLLIHFKYIKNKLIYVWWHNLKYHYRVLVDIWHYLAISYWNCENHRPWMQHNFVVLHLQQQRQIKKRFTVSDVIFCSQKRVFHLACQRRIWLTANGLNIVTFNDENTEYSWKLPTTEFTFGEVKNTHICRKCNSSHIMND